MWELWEYASEYSDFLNQWEATGNRKRVGKILYGVHRLRTDGNLLRGDFVEHLQRGVFELRIDQNKQAFRLLFFYRPGRKIYFVVCFEKKTRKTPKEQIDLALRRKSEIELDEALAHAVPHH